MPFKKSGDNGNGKWKKKKTNNSNLEASPFPSPQQLFDSTFTLGTTTSKVLKKVCPSRSNNQFKKSFPFSRSFFWHHQVGLVERASVCHVSGFLLYLKKIVEIDCQSNNQSSLRVEVTSVLPFLKL
jgi:hypothetical protein